MIYRSFILGLTIGFWAFIADAKALDFDKEIAKQEKVSNTISIDLVKKNKGRDVTRGHGQDTKSFKVALIPKR